MQFACAQTVYYPEIASVKIKTASGASNVANSVTTWVANVAPADYANAARQTTTSKVAGWRPSVLDQPGTVKSASLKTHCTVVKAHVLTAARCSNFVSASIPRDKASPNHPAPVPTGHCHSRHPICAAGAEWARPATMIVTVASRSATRHGWRQTVPPRLHRTHDLAPAAVVCVVSLISFMVIRSSVVQ